MFFCKAAVSTSNGESCPYDSESHHRFVVFTKYIKVLRVGGTYVTAMRADVRGGIMAGTI